MYTLLKHRQIGWLPVIILGAALSACETMTAGDPGNLVPATVAENPALPAIEMNGSRFHAEAFGDPADQAIVFLHGGPGGDYRSLLPMGERFDGYSLADDHFLVYWDQRGSGLSQRHDKSLLTIQTYVRDLNTLIDSYSPGRPVYVVGHSWGGMFATRYINEYPEKVAGAVLIEPGPFRGTTMERLKNDISPLDLTAEWLNDYAWSSQFLTADDHARMDYERMLGVRDSQPKFHVRTVDPEPVWRLGAAANRYIMEDGQDGHGVFTYDFSSHLDAFTTPVLFITGGMSEVLGASLQEEQMFNYPSASLVVIEGAGHDVEWVKTAEVVAQIRTYLNAREGDIQ